MGGKTGIVDYQEATSIKVGRWLLQKGFFPALDSGEALESLREDFLLGILYKDPEAKPKKHFFGLTTEYPRRVFLGVVWFKHDKNNPNESRGADEKNWVLRVYGREAIELVNSLAKEMASAFGINIFLRLVQEESRFEMFGSDYD